LLSVVALCAGVGWLYLLRDLGALAIGPKLSGALPLEELASRGAQPLLRMILAWLPAGFTIGLAFAICTRFRAVAVAVSAGLLALFVLGSTTAASEAVSRNERLSEHVWPALAQPGVWAAVAIVVTGSVLGAVVARSAGSSNAGAAGSWAA
jgi:hypothetical protein